MIDERDSNRILAAWRDQPDDTRELATEVRMMQRRADNLRRMVFWRNAVEYIVALFVIVLFGAMVVDEQFLTVMRVGAALCVAGMLFVVAQLYRRTTIRGSAALEQSCVAFHRAELERQRDALATVARWYLGPLVPGLLTFFVGVPLATGKGWAIGLGSLAVAAMLYFAIARMNGAAARQLQEQIDALDEAASR